MFRFHIACRLHSSTSSVWVVRFGRMLLLILFGLRHRRR